MSHVTDIRLKVRDLDALEEAAEACGLELRRDQKTHAWWGSFVGDSRDYGELKPEEMGHCAHALRVKGDVPRNGSMGPWEIGVVPAKDGDGYNLYYDTYGTAGSRLTARVEAGAAKLKREYAARVATKEGMARLARQGFSARRVDLPGGRIQIKMRKR